MAVLRQSDYKSVQTSGITELCGPADNRIGIVLSPPSTSFIGLIPGLDPTAAPFVVYSSNQPLVISYQFWGSMVQGPWMINDFGTPRLLAWVEVREITVPEPAGSGSLAPAGTPDPAHPESTSSADLDVIVGASGRRYRRVPGGLARY